MVRRGRGVAAGSAWGVGGEDDDQVTVIVDGRDGPVGQTDDERVVDIGPIVTSAGVSAGIDMSLHVVARLHGIDVAQKTARAMEYDWKPLESTIQETAS